MTPLDPKLFIKPTTTSQNTRVLFKLAEGSEWDPSRIGAGTANVHYIYLPSKATNSDLYLFADDTKTFKGIFCQEDCEKLQQDLDKIQDWTDNSLLKFQPDKYKQMRIGRRDIPCHQYNLGNPPSTLPISQQAKDIGVIIDPKLSFEHHIAAKINKANSVLGLINRTFEYKDPKTMVLLYKSLVHPHLEYANQIWAPTPHETRHSLGKCTAQSYSRTSLLRTPVTTFSPIQRTNSKVPNFRNALYMLPVSFTAYTVTT